MEDKESAIILRLGKRLIPVHWRAACFFPLISCVEMCPFGSFPKLEDSLGF